MKIANSLLVALLLLVTQSCWQFDSKSKTTIEINSFEEQAVETLRELYTSYITESCKIPTDVDAISALKNKYFTVELQKN